MRRRIRGHEGGPGMRMLDLIEKKKRGHCHDAAEIRFLVQEFTAGRIPDYQMAAWLMAVWFRNLNEAETVWLTQAMAASGSQLDLSAIAGITVDKHSTGGVADTTTLIVAPLAAAAGVKVAKMAGRGLGFTGGTIDKLEAIPGFRTALSEQEFIGQVNRIGMAVMGQTAELAPADGKIYALRDATGIVDSLPLIAASVMSKKLAAGAAKILLDVKYGSGAFMNTLAEAVELARVMVGIGQGAGRETVAFVTSMEEPLGTAIGNSLEVAEAVDILSGRGDERLRGFCVRLTAQLLVMARAAAEQTAARRLAEDLLDSGAGLVKFKEFVAAQGGDSRVADDPARLGRAACSLEVRAQHDGYVTGMAAAELGRAAVLLGAGRSRKGDVLDLTAGIQLHCRCGDRLQAGASLATLYFAAARNPAEAAELVRQAVKTGPEPVTPPPLIAGMVDASGYRPLE